MNENVLQKRAYHKCQISNIEYQIYGEKYFMIIKMNFEGF